KMIRDTVRDFATNVIQPRTITIDKEATFPVDIFKQMGELGLMGIPFPEVYGGSGGDTISYALAVEEIGKVCASTGLSYAAAVSLGATPIYAFGTEEQKEKYLKPLAEGKTLGAFGLTEPNAGSDAGGTQTTATLDGQEFIINVENFFITNASYAKTILLTIVICNHKRIKNNNTAIIIQTDADGITITNNYNKMGVRGSDTA